jgi:hypothetical protein
MPSFQQKSSLCNPRFSHTYAKDILSIFPLSGYRLSFRKNTPNFVQDRVPLLNKCQSAQKERGFLAESPLFIANPDRF